MALNRLLGRLEQTLVKERRFTADAAHELRTPLAGLRVQLQLAMRATDEQQRRETMNKALQGIDRSTHLVNQLLTLARADRENARTLTFRPVDLVQQANEVADSLQKEARQNRIRLSIESGQLKHSIEGEPPCSRSCYVTCWRMQSNTPRDRGWPASGSAANRMVGSGWRYGTQARELPEYRAS